ncbi:DNA polymerase III subunit alpha [Listeria sp. ILCC792]|uniref:DNA polymerase III subunit alpha n=1 Tax=Listeria sp. ILCC792 TaxID=1918331 RepID=UPI000B594B73|nr:DNA polymerase III subunit alpha [Listeria sp. ILCC792]
MGFVHLQVASAYHLLSSTARISELVQTAKDYHYSALAITDKNALYGAIEFYTICKKEGIKPIIGMTIDIEGVINPGNTYELVLLAETTEGYYNLLKIASAIKTREEGEEMPLKWLRSYCDGIIALSPGRTGEIEQLLLDGNQVAALEVVSEWQSIFGETNFYLTLQKHQANMAQAVAEFAQSNGLFVVASKNVRYMRPKDIQATTVLQAIRDNQTVDWTSLELVGPTYFASPDEMARDYTSSFEQEALMRAGEIADRCNAEVAMHQHLLPRFPLEKGELAPDALQEVARAGLVSRGLDGRPEYEERLSYELDVIVRMGFADYFLIVWDVMKYAREHDILTGPGRGSAAGSLVSYALQITDVDPILYNLLFERFLNPERVTMPDIDLDFPDNKRDDVISYVVHKYGEKHVAQIGTFGTLAAKAAIRDTARTFGLNTVQLAEWAKLIPNQLGITLAKARELNDRLDRHIASTKENEMIWDVACQLEGLPRHISTHAAGIVISDKPLVSQVPLQAGSNDALLTQYPMNDLEAIGLLKMDFLGLRNLSLLDRVLRSVNYNRKLSLTIQDIPLDDKKTLELFRRGDTTGVFQFESDGIRRVLRNLQPTSFEDIVAVDALYRPGPMEQIDTFIARKHGKQAAQYPHPDLKPILEVTYGVIVYQEQIIQVANQMAGFSLGEADLLRRAVSKKKADVLNEQRQHFVLGSVKKGYLESSANEVYDMIVRFANYGFNRSHAAAYSKIAFQLAYLKAHFPAEFMSALLSSVFGNDAKISQYVTEVKKYGISMLPPSINKSHYYFQVEGDAIRYSFRVIRKVPNKFILAFIEERKMKPFQDFFDFCERMPSKMMTRIILEALIYAGCFDEFGKERATLIASIDGALQFTNLLGNDEKGMNLFTEDDDFLKSIKPRYREVSPLTEQEMLELEKEYTGQYVSSHPISRYQDKMQKLNMPALHELKKGQKATIGAYILNQKIIRTKKGENMCFLTISDDSKELSAVLFPEAYRQFAALTEKGSLVALQVKMDERNGELQAVVQHVQTLDSLELPKRLFLKVEEKSALEKIRQLAKANPGPSVVVVHLSGTRETMALPAKLNVTFSTKLEKELKDWLGEQNVVFK